MRVVGDFQDKLIPGTSWQVNHAINLLPQVLIWNGQQVGYLYQSYPISLPEGFYQYQYVVNFDGVDAPRWCNDPLTRYHHCEEFNNEAIDHSGFIIGGKPVGEVGGLMGPRLPLQDLVIYELHLEEFTAEHRGLDTPIQALQKKIDYLKSLGVNAVEIQPWQGCPGGTFNWGYDPFLPFSVANRYTNDKANPLDKLSQLGELITALHHENIQVIMDGVFNHVSEAFPYYQLYRDQESSPYIGTFRQAMFNRDLDYYNNCTNDFVYDLCLYWLKTFKLDGIRFDNTQGFCEQNDVQHGFTKLMRNLNNYCTAHLPEMENIAFIMEHLDDYKCIDVSNKVGANGTWLNPVFWAAANTVNENTQASSDLMRLLDSAYDFNSGTSPVTYIENHDHSNIVEYIGKGHDNRGSWWLTQPYMIQLLTTAGAVMLHSGQEWAENYWMPETDKDEARSCVNRVTHRMLHWKFLTDNVGKQLWPIYQRLIDIRKKHSALRSPNFYPRQHYGTAVNSLGYGFDGNTQVAIFNRYDNSERLIVVINYSQQDKYVDIPFPANEKWIDLLNDKEEYPQNWWLRNYQVRSNWGCIFQQPN